MMSEKTIDIVFDGPPGPISGHFVEVERDGAGVSIGEWVQDGALWRLRIPDPDELALLRRALVRLRHISAKQLHKLRATNDLDALEMTNALAEASELIKDQADE